MENPFFKAMSTAASGLAAQGFRLRVVSENVANADTPGYHRKLIAFDDVYDRKDGVTKVEVGRLSLDPAKPVERYDPTNPLADDRGFVQASNVNTLIEVADGREASRSYEANLATFQQARQMYSSLLDLLRR
ncbi:MAG: flagellar basal body rod protein FlgC [Parvularculaceae bacterium]|nr:flagellar basal body rod protein FlgC [Parvularculaceae bacterium]